MFDSVACTWWNSCFVDFVFDHHDSLMMLSPGVNWVNFVSGFDFVPCSSWNSCSGIWWWFTLNWLVLIVYFLNFFVVFMILVFVIEFHLIVLHWLTCCLRDVLISSGKFKMLSMKHGHGHRPWHSDVDTCQTYQTQSGTGVGVGVGDTARGWGGLGCPCFIVLS